MKYYQAVIDHYGSAPFLVRTGKKPRSDSNLNVLDEARDSFTHFGSVIVEKPDYQKNEYQIRFVDPSSNEDVVYKIQNGKLNDVLLRLHNVYSNGNPSNNLGGSGIRASMFDSGTLSKNSIKIPRQSQSGLQCGIHSSRRIIPASVYKKLGVDDCDIAKLVNI